MSTDKPPKLLRPSEMNQPQTTHQKAASVNFNGVSKIYGGTVTAVDNISLEIRAGELVTLLGPSGCGKTTTLRMIAGLEMASSGQILIGDNDVTRLPATERDVSMVFQSYALFPHMTVHENVAYGLRVAKHNKQEVDDKTLDGLKMVGLEGFGSRLPSELSGGQQQRVAVARALVLEPSVLLFDEPLSNLDAKLRRQVREEIRELQQTLGLTVVYVTHDQEEALAVSDRIVVMRNASIAQTGSPRDLYEQPVDTFVADFIGEANIIETVIESVDKAGVASVRIGDLRLDLDSRNLEAGDVRLAVRPNRIDLFSPDTPTLNDTNSVAGSITKATYVGNHMEYSVNTRHGDWFVTSGKVHEVFKEDDEIRIKFADRGPVLVKKSG